jgi:hypothetical protein
VQVESRPIMAGMARVKIRCRMSYGQCSPASRKRHRSPTPTPDGIAFVVSEHHRIVPPHHFACQHELGFTLLHLRTRERDIVSLVEAHAHLRKKRLWAEVDIDCVGF